MPDIYTVDSEMSSRDIWSAEGAKLGPPDLCREVRKAAVDYIRRNEPSTVLGLLMTQDDPMTVEAVAGMLNMSVEEVEWTLEMLEAEELGARIMQDDGLVKVFAFAPYSARNE